MTEQDKFHAKLNLEHTLNPVHIYTKLMKTGIPEKEAMQMAREYERLLTQSKIFKLLFNP
jgi:hypothetical protein